MLLTFIAVYLVISIGIGLYAAKRVKNTADYAVAGRSMPLAVVIAMTFATWFGSETVLGVSARFVQGGLGSVVEDPVGASMCLILVGLFFAYKLYQKNLITIGDYYRQRYGKVIEITCSIIIMVSYLGWVAAQITALGLVFNLLTQGQISTSAGMVLGTAIVLVYTLYGGMWSVAMTDFIQMIVIALGLIAIAWFASDLAGGAGKVMALAQEKGSLKLFPTGGIGDWIPFIAAAVTMMLGSIPQQDVFARVMSSKNAKTAVRGPVIGGILYFLFALVPMFVVMAAVLIMPETTNALLKDDPQKVLPTLVMEKMPLLLQIAFFGALLSAIMSTASATLLAPSTTFVENILRNIKPSMSDAATLKAMRWSVLVFTALVLTYALSMQGTSIYDLVSGAYQITLVGAFVPLVFGLYWKRATTQGAVLSIVLGVGTWLAFLSISSLAELFPAQLAGLIAALIGMFAGTLLPQAIADKKGHVHHFTGSSYD
ncbi:MAG: sodium:solute symporter family protein [Polaromonas sp.]|jgi:SSS family solute:Na+ symporter|nr:sodium:solute symporter family protein [Polaromonas sp.]MBK9339912.1 sodium:solute symporter family protein [Rhodoferax sp.]MBK7025902.1 sodium:solute symporter family protein [Polaromonas sp.]MBP6089302.1 sodium:solute symporter family protein [Polaromonas sp.]MBP6142370.1 sodium:solute symporter family protein [Polaromonas sp.]